MKYDALHRVSLLAVALDLHEPEITDTKRIASFDALHSVDEFILLCSGQCPEVRHLLCLECHPLPHCLELFRGG
jgi:hypothetical protein